jgi:hypothetical protein
VLTKTEMNHFTRFFKKPTPRIKLGGIVTLTIFAITGVSFLIQKIYDFNIFDDIQESFNEPRRFAEAYGGSCNFEEGWDPFNDITSFYPQWSSGFSVVTVPDETYTNVSLPFDFKYSGRFYDDLDIYTSFNEVDSRDIDQTITMHPGYATYGTDDRIEYTLDGARLSAVPNSHIDDSNNNNTGDYYIRRRDDVKTKSFVDGGRDVFGFKFEYYTPENAPFQTQIPSVIAYSRTPTDIYAADFFSDVNGDDIILTNTFTQPANGTVTLDSVNNKYVYTPNGNFAGTDTFDFTVSANGDTATGTMTLDVVGLRAYDDNYDATPGTHTIDVLANDYHDPSSVSIAIIDGPERFISPGNTTPWGSAVVNGTSIDFTVPSTNNGYLIYEVTDNVTGEVETARLDVDSISSGGPLIDNSARGNTLNLNELVSNKTLQPSLGGLVTIHPLQQDFIFEDNGLTLSITDFGPYGTPSSAYTVNPDNSITIDTIQLEIEFDYIEYTVTNNTGTTNTVRLNITTVGATEFSRYIYFVDETYDIVYYEAADDYSAFYNTEMDYWFETASDSETSDTNVIDNTFGFGSGEFYSPGEGFDQNDFTLFQLNCSPFANDDYYIVDANTTTNLEVIGDYLTNSTISVDNDQIGSDYDYEYFRSMTDSPFTVTSVSTPSNGSAVAQPDNTIDYTPNNGFTGNDDFEYCITDTSTVDDEDNSEQTCAWVNLDVQAAPISAVDDNETTDEDTTITVDVTSNDNLGPNPPINVTSFTQGTNGTVVQNGNNLEYTPNQDYFGTDTFTYTITDSNNDTDTATVTITVEPVNDDPVAVDDVASVDEDSSVSVDVLANDDDPVENDPLTIDSFTQGSNGSVAEVNGELVYTPNQDYFGTDSFTYTISDGNGGTDSATVSVTINPINDDPVAVDDTDNVDEDSSVTVDVLANDSDPVENDPLTIDSFTQGTNGTVTEVNGELEYTPNQDYFGTDTFTYTISDGNGGTDSATVTITVNSVNDDPIVNDDTAGVNENDSVIIDVLANDDDLVEGDQLTICDTTNPSNGTIQVINNQIEYTPNQDYNGTDTFTYTACDGNGGEGTATITVTVNEVNDDPNVVDDLAQLDENTSVTIDVLANDTDPQDDILEICDTTNPSNGTIEVVNGEIIYTPNQDYNGTDTFTYTACDGNGGEGTATVTVTVNEIQALEVDVIKASNETLTVGQRLGVRVDTRNPNTSAIQNVTTTITFDDDRFDLVAGSVSEVSQTALLLDILSIQLQAQGFEISVNNNEIEVTYDSIEAGETRAVGFELTSQVVGNGEINAVAQFDDITSEDTEDADIIAPTVNLPRSGGIAISIIAVIVGAIVAYVTIRQRKSSLKVDTKGSNSSKK